MVNRRLQERARFKKKGPCGRVEDYDAMKEDLKDWEADRQY